MIPVINIASDILGVYPISPSLVVITENVHKEVELTWNNTWGDSQTIMFKTDPEVWESNGCHPKNHNKRQ